MCDLKKTLLIRLGANTAPTLMSQVGNTDLPANIKTSATKPKAKMPNSKGGVDQVDNYSPLWRWYIKMM